MGTVADRKQGHPLLFSESKKYAMKKFLTAATIMGIPRTEEMFHDDLVHFCEQNNKIIRSKRGKIGKLY